MVYRALPNNQKLAGLVMLFLALPRKLILVCICLSCGSCLMPSSHILQDNCCSYSVTNYLISSAMYYTQKESFNLSPYILVDIQKDEKESGEHCLPYLPDTHLSHFRDLFFICPSFIK